MPGGSRNGSKPPANIGRDGSQHPTQSFKQPRVLFLVICGATDAKTDDFIFSDFMGFCTMLMEKGIFGDFVSCFPVRLSLKYMKNEYNIESFKFGKVILPGTTSESWLYQYTRQQFEQEPLWFTEIAKEDLKEYVKSWVKRKVDSTEPGDTVNIVFEGHSSRYPSIRLGRREMQVPDFVDLIAKFKPGVQVNFINGACLSAQFVDAISASGQSNRFVSASATGMNRAYSSSRTVSGRARSSRWSQASVQSLARTDFGLGPTQASNQVTIANHQDYIAAEILRRPSVPAGVETRDPGTFAVTSPASQSDLIGKVVFNDMVGVEYDPAATRRRQRRQWPATNAMFFHDLGNQAERNATPSAKDLADSLIDGEISKCGGLDDLLPADKGIMDAIASSQVRKRPRDQVGLLHALYWRARQQLAALDLFSELVALGLLNPKALEAQVDHHGSTAAVSLVDQQLSCFELPRYEDNADCDDRPYKLWGPVSFDAPLRWLAVMIVRGCVCDMSKILEVVRDSRCLGSLDEEAYDKFLKRNKSAYPISNPEELRPSGAIPGFLPFGLWLPSNLPERDWTPEAVERVRCACVSKFNEIEYIYKMYFDFPESAIRLAKGREHFFAMYPHRMSGRPHQTYDPSTTALSQEFYYSVGLDRGARRDWGNEGRLHFIDFCELDC
ncbi:MAG: hypothetical protein Q9198_000158 [Flavoplaca austrocitrina]